MNSEKYDVRRDAQKSCSFFLSFFLHADFLFSLGIPYHNIDCVSLSLYFDLSLSLFLLALNIFDNHFWITKRLWICALFRFVRCISIWGSKLAYNCLHSLADIPKMCKKSLQKKKLCVLKMNVYVSKKCVIKVTRMCKMWIWNLSHRWMDLMQCPCVCAPFRERESSCCQFLKNYCYHASSERNKVKKQSTKDILMFTHTHAYFHRQRARERKGEIMH